MPLGVMLDLMPSSEITEWMAYFRLDQEDREREKHASKADSMIEDMRAKGFRR